MNKDLIGNLAWGGGIVAVALAASLAHRLGHGDAETRRRIAIDRQLRLQPFCLLVGVGVADLRNLSHSRQQFLRPFVEIADAVGAQRVLILRVAGPSTHTDVLRGLQIQCRPRDA